MKTKYFDSSGNEIDESAALNRHGILRDGCTVRVSMQMRDSNTARGPRITDGSNNPFALNRPGWRMRVGDNRQAVHDAYQRYDNDLINQWRDGIDDEDTNAGMHHENLPHRADSCTPDIATQHGQVMDRLYAEHDNWLQNAWRLS